jgi:cytochrome c556
MKKIIATGAIALALASVALAHDQHEHATGAVKERMLIMTDLGERLLAISKRLRANRDLQQVTPDAQAIEKLAAKIVAQFPPGSTQAPTAAKPDVWKDWATFEATAKKLQTEADALAKTNPADGDALRLQFRMVAFTCDECHEKFRVPQKK